MSNTLHFIWIGAAAMPWWAAENLEAFKRLNPDREVVLHTDDTALWPEWRAAFDAAEDPASKADLLRYSILRRHGGWYFDLDFVPFRPLADAERAWGLDGRTMFIARQEGQRNAKWTHTNSVVSATPDWRGWKLIDEYVATTSYTTRVHYGPRMMVELVKRDPGAFTCGDAPWFFPARVGVAGGVWERYRESRNIRHLCNLHPGTTGQAPFAMHLWAAGADEIDVHTVRPRDSRKGTNGKVAVLALMQQQWDMEWQPFPAIADGLHALGYSVEVRSLGDEHCTNFADVVVVWNGRKGLAKEATEQATRAGIPVLFCEHGFLGCRRKHVQLNAGGILHWASWCTTDYLRSRAPDYAFDLLDEVLPAPVPEFDKRTGPCLVVGQVDGDTQLQDSAVQHASELERFCARAHVQAIFRDHPKSLDRPQHTHRLPRLPDKTLREAAEQCKCGIMVNSNAGNELLSWGIPVLAFGPAVYLTAGVATEVCTRNMAKKTIALQLPARDAVVNYLAHLADRQYTHEQFREGTVLRRILREAGVE
jgi:hypothetical protein